MSAAPRTVSLLTAEPDFKIHTIGSQPPLVVARQSWKPGGVVLDAELLDAEDTDATEIDAEMIVWRLATDNPSAVCIAPDVPEQLALDIAVFLDQHHPNVGVILVRPATPRLWKEAARAGVRDIIAPNAIDSALLPALHKAVERYERLSSTRLAEPPPVVEIAEPEAPTGRVIVVLSPKGGSGKTMVASNLAAALAYHTGGGTVLVDLDCVFGDVASVLGLVPEHTVGHLALLPTLDSTTLKVLLTRHEESGLHVLAGSGVPEEGESVTDELSGQVLDMLARDFAYVVVDTAAGLDERALAAIEKATDIVFVASMDITSIRNLGKEINALDRLGMTRANRSFVLNRADAEVGLDVGDVEAAIGMKVSAALPSSRLVPLSMNRGKTLVLEEPDSPVAQQLLAMAGSFIPVDPNAQLEESREDPFVLAAPAMKLSDRMKEAGVASPPQIFGIAGASETATPSSALDAFKKKVHDALLERLGVRLFDSTLGPEQLNAYVAQEISDLMTSSAVPLSPTERQALLENIMNDVVGLGPVEQFLADPTVSEVMVNGLANIYVERRGVIVETEARFLSEDHLRRVIDRIVSRVGRRIDESSPMVDARLPDGSRVNAIIPPLSVSGPALTIRKFAVEPYQVDDLIELGTLTPELSELLKAVVEVGLNILVSGGTGTGKTTLLNVLSGFIPEGERIVTIEDSVELQLHRRHVVRLESRPPNVENRGEVTVRDLVRNSLRMRPDRIIVGEVRGAEALDMLQAMNTGHEGSISTVHANSPRDTLARLETMVLMSGIDLPSRAIREQIASALDLVVHIHRFRDGTRRITQVTEVSGLEGEVITMSDIYAFDTRAGRASDGSLIGRVMPTGIRPMFTDRLREAGIALPAELYGGSTVIDIAGGWGR